MHRLADAFDELPEVVEGVRGARMLLAPGLSVHAFAIYGLLGDDGAIDLVALAISTAPARRRLGAGSSAGITTAGRRRGREPR
jgi:hypothetical protein